MQSGPTSAQTALSDALGNPASDVAPKLQDAIESPGELLKPGREVGFAAQHMCLLHSGAWALCQSRRLQMCHCEQVVSVIERCHHSSSTLHRLSAEFPIFTVCQFGPPADFDLPARPKLLLLTDVRQVGQRTAFVAFIACFS